MRLKKGSYGCRQSGRLWIQSFTDFLTRLGFKQNQVQPCVWNLAIEAAMFTIGFLVDDILHTCNFEEHMQWFVDEINTEFKDNKDQKGSVLGALAYLNGTSNLKLLIDSSAFTAI